MISQIESCRTLDRPTNCPEAVYQLMLGSWHRIPSERLTMNELRTRLDSLYRDEMRRYEPALTRVQVGYEDPEKPFDRNRIDATTSGDSNLSSSTSRPDAEAQYLQLLSGSIAAE